MKRARDVVAITDVHGGVIERRRARHPVPAPVPRRARHDRRRTGHAARSTNDELFALDVDVLVLAALEGQITAANAGTRAGPDPGRSGQRSGRRPDADPILRAQRRRSSSRTSSATRAA